MSELEKYKETIKEIALNGEDFFRRSERDISVLATAVYLILEQIADRKTEPSDSEKPNNSHTCANCKFDHEEWFEEACDSCCDAHSNWQPKTEPQTEDTPDCPFCIRYGTEDCLGSDCRHYKTYKDEPRTDPCDRYVVTNDEGERAYNCIGCEQTDCAWMKGE